MPIVIGSLDYFGVPFPLVLADRFFVVYKSAFGFNVDVFRWDPELKQHVYEVMYGKPVTENIDASPNGAITFRQITPKLFIYKFRARQDIPQIYGKVPTGKEFVVKIDEREIRVLLDNIQLASFTRNQTEGPLGLVVNADGSYVFGGDRLPAGMELKRGYYAKK